MALMSQALKTLRILQWAMLGSILFYVGLGIFLRPAAHTLDPALSYLFTTLGVALIGIIFVVRRTLVFRAGESLVVHPEDVLSLNQWKTGYIATYALCESLAVFGLIEHFLGGTLQQSMSYFIGGFALMLFFRPRQPTAG